MASRNRTITPQEFVAKWRASTLKESSASQEHFIDLCRELRPWATHATFPQRRCQALRC